ncbi:cold shock domain-containing protein [Kribbella sp. NPDC004536]|uniref:cold shock domain-containing protein n=1 Tax=Kribbella sp. NPDC004536 TaxID=3364106 RepID=UPI0036AE19A7
MQDPELVPDYSSETSDFSADLDADSAVDRGTVKWFSQRKRFGFITNDEGVDYFFHESAVPLGSRIGRGDVVTFQLTDGQQGPEARELAILEQVSSDEEPARHGPSRAIVDQVTVELALIAVRLAGAGKHSRAEAQRTAAALRRIANCLDGLSD